MKHSLTFLAAVFIAVIPDSRAADDYKLGSDSQPKDGVPVGIVEKFTFKASKIFPGTERDYWVYVPKQYDASKPAALMVFQDGGGYQSTNGSFRAPVVMDNLIAKKEMPVTIGVFINPGSVPPTEPGAKGRSNRSYEYDSLGDAYARFLLEELLPEIEAKWKISRDPSMRATVGISSGGIAAFTAAWERPESFGKVISHIGSFTNIRGGHVYPALIRKNSGPAPKELSETEKARWEARLKLRVFLQDGSNDLDNLHGNWPLSNQEMFAALKFSKIECDFILGDGGHSGKHGGAILPATMRWLWNDAPKKPLLLYSRHFNAAGESRYLPDGTFKEILTKLRGEFEVHVSNEPLTQKNLAGVNVILIANPSDKAVGTNPPPPHVTAGDIATLTRFTEQGGGLIIMGNQENHNLETADLNQLLTRYGLQFADRYTDMKKIAVPQTTALIGGLTWGYYTGNQIVLQPGHAAKPRSLIDNDLSAKPINGPRNEPGCLLALAEPGRGRVVLVTDAGWLTDDALSEKGIGGNVVKGQNNWEIIRRLTHWAAGR